MASFKSVRISFQERKKVFKIPEMKSTSDMEFLVEQFHKEFGIECEDVNVVFQRFDDDWNEDIDLDAKSLIEDKDKLTAVVVPNTSAQIKASSSFCSSVILDTTSDQNQSEELFDSSPELNRCSKKRKIYSDDEADCPISQRIEDPLIDGAMDDIECNVVEVSSRSLPCKRVKVEKTEDDKIPLPDPFPLPSHHSHDIEIGLKNKRLSSTEKKKFISDIASAMLCHKLYPDSADYLCVARAVITKYPFMKTSESRPYDALVRSLVNRFKEFRRPKKPRAVSSSNNSSVLPKSKPCSRKAPGITYSVKIPQFIPGEDLTSFERNNKVLQVEFKKPKRNNRVISDLMKRTFAHRYSYIQGNKCDIVNLFEKFPFLQETEHLIADMEWLIESENLRASAASTWKTLTPKVLMQAKLDAVHNSRLHYLMSQYEIKEEDDNILAALTVLPLMLPDVRTKPNHESVIYYTEANMNVAAVATENQNLSPYVLVVGDVKQARQAFLVIDKQVVVDMKFEDIPVILMSAFFVFNICYPHGCSNFYTFMEAFTFEFSLGKASPTVKHLAASLKD